MSEYRIQTVNLLKRLVEAISSLPEEELAKLSDVNYTIEIRAIRRRTKDDLALQSLDASVEDAIVEITALPSRQDAQAFLDVRFSSKKALELIARKLDIPIVRQDKVEELRDKVVEATVGARIRSQAIQGTGGA